MKNITKNPLFWFIFVALLLIVRAVYAQPAMSPDLMMSTGVSGGTYSLFAKQIGEVCKSPAILEWGEDGPNNTRITSSGGMQNIDNILKRKAELGPVQIDTLWARKLLLNDPDIDSIKVLVPLYNEAVHIIARSNDINKFSDLMNRRVGAWGGSVMTLRVLAWKTSVGIGVVDTGNFANAKSALDKGEISAFLAVGGQPIENIEKLPAGYKLIPFDRIEAVRLKDQGNLYDVTHLVYPNLSANQVPTIQTQSALVTWDFRSAAKVYALIALRRCIYENINELRETRGNHPKWKEVSSDKKVNWPMYEAVPPVGPKTGSGAVRQKSK